MRTKQRWVVSSEQRDGIANTAPLSPKNTSDNRCGQNWNGRERRKPQELGGP